jgi:heterodisulfide reductase subunit A
MGLIPRSDTEELVRMLRLQVGSDGFLLERHYKLQPVDSQREGVFLAGCVLGPKDVRETTLESMATASRVASFLGKGEISISPEVAVIIPESCNNCGACVDFCPVAAVEPSPAGVTINPISCVGCGICVPKCPQQAIELHHCTEEQLLAQIDGICSGGEGQKIVAFLEKDIAYASADLAGQTRHSYPPNVEIIGVPSVGRIGLKHVLHTFAAGADGLVFVEGHGSVLEDKDVRDHVIELKKQLKKYGVNPLRLLSITTTLPQYDRILNIFELICSRISKLGALTQEKRDHIAHQLSCWSS